MTITITAPTANLAGRQESRFIEIGGARIEAQCRHLAIVVTIHGEIDAGNVDQVSEHIRRFILVGNPLVIDLSGVNSFAAAGVSLVRRFDGDCRDAGLEWTLIVDHAAAGRLDDDADEATFPIAQSVHEALRHFADEIGERRALLLPLIAKTAKTA